MLTCSASASHVMVSTHSDEAWTVNGNSYSDCSGKDWPIWLLVRHKMLLNHGNLKLQMRK